MRIALAAASAVALVVPLAGAALADTIEATRSNDTQQGAVASLDQWEPAQVADGSDQARTPTLFSTQRGRAVAVYRVGGAMWASSRAPGAGVPWAQPHQLLGAPKDSSVGPVATGSDGGATFFLRGGFGGWTYTHMNATGDFGAVRTFPYQDQFPVSGKGLTAALERPNSALVVAGMTYRQVKVAVKPSNGPWMMSPGLGLGYYTVLRGLWQGRNGLVHVLVTQDQQLDSRSSTQDQQVDSTYPSGLYEAVLHQQNGTLTWGPLRQWRTGMVGGLCETYGCRARVLSTANGAITVMWQEYSATSAIGTVQLMRHRTAAGNWTPVRRMQEPGLPSLVASLDDSGTTRLSYISGGDNGSPYELVTRKLSPDGVLSDPVLVDGPIPHDFYPNLDGVSNPVGATLLRWRTNTGTSLEQHIFRCLSGDGCTSVGTFTKLGQASMAVTPSRAAFLAGVDAIPGCPPAKLCSRRLPPP